jgi:hypothetical protein
LGVTERWRVGSRVVCSGRKGEGISTDLGAMGGVVDSVRKGSEEPMKGRMARRSSIGHVLGHERRRWQTEKEIPFAHCTRGEFSAIADSHIQWRGENPGRIDKQPDRSVSTECLSFSS